MNSQQAGILLALALVLFLTGCHPQPESQVDELKDPYYQLGTRLVRERDYRGAADAFETALEANPRSAPAHFELALLYEEKLNDPAIALYHYKQTLRFRPDGSTTDIAMTRIKSCEQEIAKNVALIPVDPGLVAEVDRLKNENRRLQQDLEATRAHLALAITGTTNRVTPNVPTYYVPTNPYPSRPLPAPLKTNVAPAVPTTRTISGPQNSVSTASPSIANRSGSQSSTHSPIDNRARSMRTHYVRSRETLASIARQYGVSLTAIRSANPSVSPERLRVGQAINIPPK